MLSVISHPNFISNNIDDGFINADIVTTRVFAYNGPNSTPLSLTLGATSNLNLETVRDVNTYMGSSNAYSLYTTRYNDATGVRTDTKILAVAATSANTTTLTAPSNISIRPTALSTSVIGIGSMAVSQCNALGAQVLDTSLASFRINKGVQVLGSLAVRDNFITSGSIFGRDLNVWVDKPPESLHKRVGYGLRINSNDQLKIVKYALTSNDVEVLRKIAMFGVASTPSNAAVSSRVSYPPAPLMLTEAWQEQPTATFQVSGQPAGNGTYVASASSTAQRYTDVFDKDPATGWETSVAYDTVTGAPTSTAVATTDASGVQHVGQWVQLQLPKAVRVTSFGICSRQAYGPNQTVALLGSADGGATWTHLQTQTYPTAAAGAEELLYYSVGAPGAYAHYRLVITNALRAGNIRELVLCEDITLTGDATDYLVFNNLGVYSSSASSSSSNLISPVVIGSSSSSSTSSSAGTFAPSLWATNPDVPADIYYGTETGNTSNVGIGCSNPSFKLSVQGDVFASGDITASSDARLKDNVQTIEGALDKVAAIRGCTYTRLNRSNDRTYMGVIAQELKAVVPELVSADRDSYLSVVYGNMVGLLVEAIKDLKQRLEAVSAAAAGVPAPLEVE